MILLFIGLFLLFCSDTSYSSNNPAIENNRITECSIEVPGTPEFYPLTQLQTSQCGNVKKAGILANSGFFTNKLHGLSIFSMIIIALIPFILAYMITKAVGRHKREKIEAGLVAAAASNAVFDENTIEVPNGLYFDKTHTWAFMEKNGAVRVGIDDFLQHTTGALTRVEMKNPGEKVKKGEQLCSIIQKGKQLDIYAPISGTIEATNHALSEKTSIINSSPYSQGWVYLIEPTNWARELRFLLMGEKYKEWLKNEFSRLKDFLALSVKGNNVTYEHIILQDGGELKDGVLAELGPNVWEDFQTQFIDKSK